MAATVTPEHYVRKTFPLHEFIFVGCWNRPGRYRDEVAAAIMKTSVKTVILGGDNVYPLPDTKIHSTQVFYDGIQLYMNKGKDIVGTLGNHNIAFALDEEMREVDMKERQMKVFDITNSYYISEYDDKCCIVVLDTNLTEIKYETMCAWFNTAIEYMRANALQYYIVQHEPFFSVKGKTKKGVFSDKYQILENRKTILDSLFTYVPIRVLCADTHLFQQVNITSKRTGQSVVEIVVGTGGAEHDSYSLKTPWEDDSYVYELIYPKKPSEYISAYGYLHIFTPERSQFVPISAWEGGERTRKKNKKKTKRKSRKLI